MDARRGSSQPRPVGEHGAAASCLHSPMAPVVVHEQDKQLLMELTSTAADHLSKMSRSSSPRWLIQVSATSKHFQQLLLSFCLASPSAPTASRLVVAGL